MYPFIESKKNNRLILDFFKKRLFSITGNNFYSGILVFIIHFLIGGSTLIYLIFGNVKNDFYFISMLTWIIIFIMHVYFKGCILVKLERELWNNKRWFGPWTLPFFTLELFGFQINKKNSNFIFIGWSLILTIFVLYKVFL